MLAVAVQNSETKTKNGTHKYYWGHCQRHNSMIIALCRDNIIFFGPSIGCSSLLTLPNFEKFVAQEMLRAMIVFHIWKLWRRDPYPWWDFGGVKNWDLSILTILVRSQGFGRFRQKSTSKDWNEFVWSCPRLIWPHWPCSWLSGPTSIFLGLLLGGLLVNWKFLIIARPSLGLRRSWLIATHSRRVELMYLRL